MSGCLEKQRKLTTCWFYRELSARCGDWKEFLALLSKSSSSFLVRVFVLIAAVYVCFYVEDVCKAAHMYNVAVMFVFPLIFASSQVFVEAIPYLRWLPVATGWEKLFIQKFFFHAFVQKKTCSRQGYRAVDKQSAALRIVRTKLIRQIQDMTPEEAMSNVLEHSQQNALWIAPRTCVLL